MRFSGLLPAFLAISTPASACEIALALAVDVSGSVDSVEYRIQMQGLADAIRHPTVAEALVLAEADLMLVQWTGDSRQSISLPWTRVSGYGAVELIAQQIETAPRRWWQFSTAIGAALEFTRAQFEGNDCKRRVIDVSGDGSSNEGVAPTNLRTQFWRDGFTVNALAIEGSEPDLTAYFWENVIAGEGAFVITADGFADYPEKIRLKLLREVTAQLSSLPQQKRFAANLAK